MLKGCNAILLIMLIFGNGSSLNNYGILQRQLKLVRKYLYL